MAGIKAVVVFEISPGIRNFDFGVGKPGPGYEKPFMVRFGLANLARRARSATGDLTLPITVGC